jgi:hypothetical protein
MRPNLRFKLTPLFAVLALAGCQTDNHTPTIDVLGSYFPAWLACVIIGLVLALITRQLFIGFKIDAHLRPALLVYFCLVIFYTLAVWLMFFKN